MTASHGWLRLVEETALDQRPRRYLLEGLSGAERRRLFSSLLSFLEEAERLKGRSICLRGIPQGDVDLHAVLTAQRYLGSPELPVCAGWMSAGNLLNNM